MDARAAIDALEKATFEATGSSELFKRVKSMTAVELERELASFRKTLGLTKDKQDPTKLLAMIRVTEQLLPLKRQLERDQGDALLTRAGPSDGRGGSSSSTRAAAVPTAPNAVADMDTGAWLQQFESLEAACHDLGERYYVGRGQQKNYAAAAALFRKAAERGRTWQILLRDTSSTDA